MLLISRIWYVVSPCFDHTIESIARARGTRALGVSVSAHRVRRRDPTFAHALRDHCLGCVEACLSRRTRHVVANYAQSFQQQQKTKVNIFKKTTFLGRVLWKSCFPVILNRKISSFLRASWEAQFVFSFFAAQFGIGSSFQ